MSHAAGVAEDENITDSVKRVAAAVGEGAQVVATLHAVLAETDRDPAKHALGAGRANEEGATLRPATSLGRSQGDGS